jgi:rhomboid protease GluP
MITIALILLNIFLYAVLAYLSSNILEIEHVYTLELGLSREAFLGGKYWQPFTSMFIHFDLPHLGYNMVFLAIFGSKAEEIYGKRSLLIYLASGLFASLVTFRYPIGTISGGASGAIFGILGANLIAQRNLYPKGIWTSLFYGFVFFILAKSTGFAAHLAGLAFGFAVGYWITKDWYKKEEEEEEPLDEEAIEALENEMLRGP